MTRISLTAVPNFLSYIGVRVLIFLKPMFTQKKYDSTKTNRMIVLGIHVSGVIGCDVKVITIPWHIAYRYFQSNQAREAILKCLEQAKSNPLQHHISNKIRVQVSSAIGWEIQSGEVESIMGLKDFLEAIKKEIKVVTVIGRCPKDDEVIFL